MSFSPQAFIAALENLLITAPGNLADVSSPEFRAQFNALVEIIYAGDAAFTAEILARMNNARFLLALNEGRRDQQRAFTELQRAVNLRTCQVGLPQVICGPERAELQGKALRCIDGTEQEVNLNTFNDSDYNDVQISADGSTMVAAGAGTSSRSEYPFQDVNNLNYIRQCFETFITTREMRTYGGVQIYSRAICNKGRTCTAGAVPVPEWRLVQSALQDATITDVHVNSDGSEILAYDSYDNILYVLRARCVNRSTEPVWDLVQTIKLEEAEDQTYAICADMHASENHSHVAISNKNLTTNTVKVYVLTRASACEQVNGRLNQTSIDHNKLRVVQEILDQDVKYQQVTVSRDGQTLLLEYGDNEPTIAGENSGANIEFGYTGLRVYHWQREDDDSCVCQYVLRQTIVYPTVQNDYIANTNPPEYNGCTRGRTVHLHFAGANDNRIIRLVDRRADLTADNFDFNAPPWEQNIAESGLFLVFDREEIVVDICGKEVDSCKQGIINKVAGTTLRRGEFAEFALTANQQLKGCVSRFDRHDMLYTHRINKGVFMTWCPGGNGELQLYVETTEGDWIMVPPAKFPYETVETSGSDEVIAFRGYMALPENASCDDLTTVYVPTARRYAGRFIFRTMRSDGDLGMPGFFNGTDNAAVELGNNNYYTPDSSFIVSQVDRPDRPFLANFPCPRQPGDPNPMFSFTRSGNVNELPGNPAIPDPIPFPLEFNLWQRWPVDQPGFPECRTGYFKLSKVDPFLSIGCNITAEFVLTPKYYMFDPTSEEDEPNPNVDPRWIFARSSASAYIGLFTLVFQLKCFGKDCLVQGEKFPFFYHTLPAEECVD